MHELFSNGGASTHRFRDINCNCFIIMMLQPWTLATEMSETVKVTISGGPQRQRLSTQIVFFHVVPEGPKAHPQELGRFDLDAPGPLQSLRDIADLYLFDVRLEVEAGHGQRLTCRSRHG